MKRNFFLVTVLVAVTTLVQAGSFEEGNLVVYRIGDKTATYDLSVSNSAPIFLDEYRFDTDGLLDPVQSVALPTTTTNRVGTTHKSCVAVPSAPNMGLINRSADGRYIVVGGYEARPKGTSPETYESSWGFAASTWNRVIATVDVDGNINTSTALTDAYSKKDIRSVASYDGNQFWMSGDNDSGDGLTKYTTLGATSSIQVNNLTGRQVVIYKGQLYVGGQERIYKVGDGLPTSGCGRDTLTSFVDYSVSPENKNTDGLALNGSGFCFAELPGGNTVVYLSSTNGHIKKYSILANGTYKYEGDYSLSGKGMTVAMPRGIACKVEGNNVNLYFVSSADKGVTGGGGGIYWVVDKGGHNQAFDALSNPILLAPAANYTTIRSLAWAPVREAFSSVNAPAAEKISVYAKDKAIYAESDKVATIEVYNLLGVKVATDKVVPGAATQISGLSQGQIYIVKVGNTAKKVVL